LRTMHSFKDIKRGVFRFFPRKGLNFFFFLGGGGKTKLSSFKDKFL